MPTPLPVVGDTTPNGEALDAVRVAELRTPLHGVLGLAALMLDDDLSPVQRGRLHRLQDAGEHLLALLEDVRGAGSNADGTAIAPFRLATVVNQVVAAYTSAATGKGITIEGQVNGHDCLLLGDGAELRRVLGHLVDNAVRFTSEGGVEVVARTIRTTAACCAVRLTVTDTGAGMDPDLLRRISTYPTSGDVQPWPIRTGGLGLAICRQIIDRMGGTLELTAEPGGGTTATVTVEVLPAARGGPPTAALGPAPPSAAVGVSDSLPGAVLLVEDDDINQMVARGMLERLGCPVDIAADGIEAIDKLRRGSYDVVLMDCGLPRLDGYATTRHIRSLEGEARHTPVIAMTGAAHMEDRERCLAAGMDDHLAKPVSIETLADALHRAGMTSRAPFATTPGTD